MLSEFPPAWSKTQAPAEHDRVDPARGDVEHHQERVKEDADHGVDERHEDRDRAYIGAIRILRWTLRTNSSEVDDGMR